MTRGLLRLLGLVAVLALIACSNGSTDNVGPRTYDVEERPLDGASLPALDDALMGGFTSAVVDAPAALAPHETFVVVVELRSSVTHAIKLGDTSCPWFGVVYGESASVVGAKGPLPCEEIGQLRAGERIRLRIELPGMQQATTGEAGWATLSFMLGRDAGTESAIPIPMPDA